MADFEDIKKMKTPNLSNLPKKKIFVGIIVLAVIIFIATGLYTINPDEVGVIQRFGEYVSTTSPGLHFKIPFGVDNLTKVKIKNVRKEEFGFRTLKAGVETRYSSRDYSFESLMLTGDLNIANVEWIVQYKIKDPVKYLFNVRNVRETLRDLSEALTREVSGDRSGDEVIVLSRREIAVDVKEFLQTELDSYDIGIKVVTVNLQNVNPPEPVQPAFNEVNSAKQEKERIINEAWENYNNRIPEARGKAKQVVKEAEGYAINRVNRAKGEANRFLKMYKQYRGSQTVTKRRMYLEMMEKVLPKVSKVYIVDDQQKSILPLLNLDKGGK